MNENIPVQTFENRQVTYTVEIDGRMTVIEHVPARVCLETGEQLFSPQTVERIHSIIKDGHQPTRTIQTPVYEFAA